MSGCTPRLAPQRKIISVNGVRIPREDISREAQNHQAGSPAAAWTEAARALVIRKLLLQEARRLDMQPQPAVDGEGRRETDDEALVRGLVEQLVKTPQSDAARVSSACPSREQGGNLGQISRGRPRSRPPEITAGSHS